MRVKLVATTLAVATIGAAAPLSGQRWPTVEVGAFGQYTMFDLRRELYAKLQHQEVAYYDRNPVGRIMTRLTNDVDALNQLFTEGVTDLLGDLVIIVTIIVVMAWKYEKISRRNCVARYRPTSRPMPSKVRGRMYQSMAHCVNFGPNVPSQLSTNVSPIAPRSKRRYGLR